MTTVLDGAMAATQTPILNFLDTALIFSQLLSMHLSGRELGHLQKLIAES
jgi:hypothetical protein